ncbi:MAG: DinB family protein [Desulfobacterales bacterium]|nr:DinB family protein [Desulfobacterales bacterium]
MLTTTAEKFQSLTQKRSQLFQQLDELSGEILHFKAGPDKWSIVEVIEHLVIAEEDLLQQLSANIPASTLDPASKTPDRYRMVIKVMKQDIEVDVPDKRAEPRGRLTLEELIGKWDDIRGRLPEYLTAVTDEKKDDLVYRHPFGGPLSVIEALHFIEVHFDNHMRHIDRILAQIK